MNGQARTERYWMSGKWVRVLVVALLAAALLGTLIVVNGCTVVPRRRRSRVVAVASPAGGVDVVYVRKAPPKPKTEVRPKRPNKKAVWVSGHWRWNGNKYVWKKGHWDVRPGGNKWVPGHWKKNPRGWARVTRPRPKWGIRMAIWPMD